MGIQSEWTSEYRLIIATGTTGTIGSKLIGRVTPITQRREDFAAICNSKFEGNTLIHLAGIVGAERASANLQQSYDINVNWPIEIGQRIEQLKNARLVFVSTSHVYKPSLHALSEVSGIEPWNLYAEQKIEAENKLEELFKNQRQRLLILRVFSVLDSNGAENSLGYKIMRATKDSPISNGDDTRDFLSTDKIAELILNLAALNFNEPVINICSGHGLTVRAVTKLLLESQGKRFTNDYVSAGNSSVPCIVGDNARLRKTLGLSEISIF